MKVIDFNININIKGLTKIFDKGQIDELYEKMYTIADKIASF